METEVGEMKIWREQMFENDDFFHVKIVDKISDYDKIKCLQIKVSFFKSRQKCLYFYVTGETKAASAQRYLLQATASGVRMCQGTFFVLM